MIRLDRLLANFPPRSAVAAPLLPRIELVQGPSGGCCRAGGRGADERGRRRCGRRVSAEREAWNVQRWRRLVGPRVPARALPQRHRRNGDRGASGLAALLHTECIYKVTPPQKYPKDCDFTYKVLRFESQLLSHPSIEFCEKGIILKEIS